MSTFDELEAALAARASLLVSVLVLAAVAATCCCIRGDLTADVHLQAALGKDGDAQLRSQSKVRHRRLELRWYGTRLFSQASAEPVDLSSEVEVALSAAAASAGGTEAATPAARQHALQSCGLRTSSEDGWYALH